MKRSNKSLNTTTSPSPEYILITDQGSIVRQIKLKQQLNRNKVNNIIVKRPLGLGVKHKGDYPSDARVS